MLHNAGTTTIFKKGVEQIWWTRLFFGLRCNLDTLPPLRPAIFAITLNPTDSRTFRGFLQERGRVHGPSAVDIFLRQSLCDAGVQTLYTATGPDGTPAYAQWLISAGDQDILHSCKPGRYPILAPNEVLLEGRYTFSRFRRGGVATNGAAQLLRLARAKGARTAFTYVAADNAPALHSSAQVGFRLDHVRRNIRRLGFRRSVVQPVDELARQIWILAVSDRTRRQ
jgi:hypothetical protein